MTYCQTSRDCPVHSGVQELCHKALCTCPPNYVEEEFEEQVICRLALCQNDDSCNNHGACANDDAAEELTGSKFARRCVCEDNFEGASCRTCNYYQDYLFNQCNLRQLTESVDGVIVEMPKCDFTQASLTCMCPKNQVQQKKYNGLKVKWYYECLSDECDGCSGNGICNVPEKGYTELICTEDTRVKSYCSCMPGYTGSQCQQCSESPNRDPHNGCNCMPGYMDNFEGSCVPSDCKNKGDCNNGYCALSKDKSRFECICDKSFGGITCTECGEGYILHNGVCISQNTCFGTGSRCPEHSECKFNEEKQQYECYCTQEEGAIYETYNFRCVLTTCVTEQGGVQCSNHGDCKYKGPAQQYACICRTGYSGQQCQSCGENYTQSGTNCNVKQSATLTIGLLAGGVFLAVAIITIIVARCLFVRNRDKKDRQQREQAIDPAKFEEASDVAQEDVFYDDCSQNADEIKSITSLANTSVSLTLPEKNHSELKPVRRQLSTLRINSLDDSQLLNSFSLQLE